jgi:hypothetical protein
MGFIGFVEQFALLRLVASAHHWDYGDVPTWIEAAATVAAFIAAFFAARWTAKTANSARDQVEVARKQLASAGKAARKQLTAMREQVESARAQVEQGEKAAQGQLAAMREQLDLARSEATAAKIRFLHAQLDALAPVVYARAAHPRLVMMPLSEYRAAPNTLYNPDHTVKSQVKVSPGEDPYFGLTFSIELVNCGDIPARIDFAENPNAELRDMLQHHEVLPGQEVVIPPHEGRALVWRRGIYSGDLRVRGRVQASDVALAQIKYLVRDLGMNVRDTYRWNLDLGCFALDGSHLVADPLNKLWRDKFASQVPPRSYERLEASAAEGDGTE